MKNHLNQAVYQSKRSEIRQFSKLAKETHGCVALTLGEPDFATPLEICNEVDVSFENNETHYIDNNGSSGLREAIVQFEKEYNGVTYDPNEVIVTVGATEALFVALFGILNPGDEVIIPTPAFLLYEEIVKLCRAVPVALDTSGNDFQIDGDVLKSLVTERTKAIILNSPNNPTGTILNQGSLNSVYQVVKNLPIFVICDDVYRQLIYVDSYHSFSEYQDIREKLLIVQSFSKPYAMTGWRVGYLLADKSIKERLELVHQYNVVSTPAPFQRACIKALQNDTTEFISVYTKRREYVLKRLAEMHLDVSIPGGAFYVFPSIKEFGISSKEFCIKMIQTVGLAVTPGYCLGTEGFIRLTYCYSDEQLAEGMNRLERFVQLLRDKEI